MATLYVVDPRARVKREGETLLVTIEGRTVLRARLVEVERCVLAGRAWLSRAALEALLARGVETVLLDRGGDLVGRVVGPEGGHAELRLAQALGVHDPATSLRLARAMVVAKIRNSRRVLQRLRGVKAQPAVGAALAALTAARKMAQTADSVDVLRGWEGRAGALYFGVWPRLLPADYGFRRRRRRPPPDPVNALLSLGYTLVGGEIAGALSSVGLDAHLGFLHRPRRGRESLALDLLEVFRPEAVDRLTLGLCRRRELRPEHFEPAEQPGGVKLRPEALRRYLELYERHVCAPAQRGRQGHKRRLSLRECLLLEARALRAAVESGERYTPYLTH